MESGRKIHVLFVCIGNSCRSPMAEAIARQDFPELWEVASGGLTPLGYIAPLSIETIERNGYCANGLSSKPIMHAHCQEIDLVINMSGYSKNRALEKFKKVEDWDVGDPFGGDPEVYQQIFEEIWIRITRLAERLRRLNTAEFFGSNSRRTQ